MRVREVVWGFMRRILFSYFFLLFFFLMIRRPPRSTQSRSSAASDVYKRQLDVWVERETMIKFMGENSGFIGVAIAFFLGSAAACLLYTSPSPRDRTRSRMPSSA